MYLVPTDDPFLVRNILIASGEKPSMQAVTMALRTQLVLLAYDDGVLRGFVTFRAINEVTQEIHLHLMEKGLGRKVVAAAKDFMFAHTPTQKIVALIPEHRMDIKNLARKCKFKFDGCIPNANMHEGTLESLHIYGVNK